MSELFLPCPVASWNELKFIDDQTKYCKECGIHVYRQKSPGAKCGIDNSDSDKLSYVQFIMRFLVILVIAFGSSLFSGVFAQETATKTSVQEVISTITIRGQVFDEDGEEMPMAIIIIESEGERLMIMQSDFDGNYCLSIPDSLWIDDKIKISFKYAGYPTRIYEVEKPDDQEINLIANFEESDDFISFPVAIYVPLIDKDPDSKRMTTISGKDIRIMCR